MHGFHFASPAYLYALVVVPLFLLYAFTLRRRRTRFAADFTNVDVVAAVVARRGKRTPRRNLPLVLLSLALLVLVLALAEPRVTLSSASPSTTVVLLVDVSGSMKSIDVKPTRLDAATVALHDFVATLPANDKVGLVTFSDKVQTLAVPTTDHALVDSKVNTLATQGGTALGEGVVGAVKLLVSTLAAAGIHHEPGTYLPAAIVLESDGAQNRGTITPHRAAQLAADAGIRIYGVALGTNGGYVTQGQGFYMIKVPVPPAPQSVGLLARVSGGDAFSARDATSLDSVYKHLGSSIGTTSRPTQIDSWFEAAAALLLVAAVIAARRWGGALP